MSPSRISPNTDIRLYFIAVLTSFIHVNKLELLENLLGSICLRLLGLHWGEVALPEMFAFANVFILFLSIQTVLPLAISPGSTYCVIVECCLISDFFHKANQKSTFWTILQFGTTIWDKVSTIPQEIPLEFLIQFSMLSMGFGHV